MLLLSRLSQAISPVWQIFTVIRLGFFHAYRKQLANASLISFFNLRLWWQYMLHVSFDTILDEADRAWAKEKADLIGQSYVSQA